MILNWAGWMVQWLRELAVLKRTQVWFLALTWPLEEQPGLDCLVISLVCPPHLFEAMGYANSQILSDHNQGYISLLVTLRGKIHTRA